MLYQRVKNVNKIKKIIKREYELHFNSNYDII